MSRKTSRKTFHRRALILAGGAGLAVGATGVISQTGAQASSQSGTQALAPTKTMRGGANNYRPGAAVVDRIGQGGFTMHGTVRRAGDGAPLAGQRIQVWAHTVEGHERDPESHGATLTDEKGVFRMDMPQIIPAFGQAHAHLAYDSAAFQTVFLRPVMARPSDTSLEAHFVLQEA